MTQDQQAPHDSDGNRVEKQDSWQSPSLKVFEADSAELGPNGIYDGATFS